MFSNFEKVAPTFYGISLVPRKFWREYGLVLLNIAGSDGDISGPELEWLTISCAEAVGVEEAIVSEWKRYSFEKDNLENLFVSLNATSFVNFNKLLIYDAIRMAGADGDYAKAEKDRVYEAAKIMKAAPETVTAIEALIELEQAAEKLRLTIF